MWTHSYVAYFTWNPACTIRYDDFMFFLRHAHTHTHTLASLAKKVIHNKTSLPEYSYFARVFILILMRTIYFHLCRSTFRIRTDYCCHQNSKEKKSVQLHRYPSVSSALCVCWSWKTYPIFGQFGVKLIEKVKFAFGCQWILGWRGSLAVVT